MPNYTRLTLPLGGKWLCFTDNFYAYSKLLFLFMHLPLQVYVFIIQ